MSSEDNDAGNTLGKARLAVSGASPPSRPDQGPDHDSGQGPGHRPERGPGQGSGRRSGQGSELIDQQDSLISLGESRQDDAEKQFRSTCEKIREIEERARHSVKPHGVEHRCSFCNRTRVEAGALCQADQIDICICQQCAEAALELLQQQGD